MAMTRRPTVEPRAKGIVARIAPGEPDDARALEVARRVVRRRLRGEWVVRPLGADSRDYRLTRRSGRGIPLGRAFDLCRELRADRDVADAEPALVTPGLEPDPEHRAELVGPSASGLDGAEDPVVLPCANDREWSLKRCRVPEAWALGGGAPMGKGIVVGHPDTGFTRHYEIWSADPGRNRLLIDRGFDFLDDDADAEDPLRGSRIPLRRSPGHGTSTASVIMAEAGPVAGRETMSGAAPRAALVPMRVTERVILLHYDALAEALHRAGDGGHHVVSISLGGPAPVDYLERAVDYAIDRGVIVLAAAGNVWPFVVWPAQYDQVVAVAATNCLDQVWSDSATGEAVDLAAPGESVWRARAGGRGPADDGISQGSGTSFAVATTAGACALWLAHHGREALIDQYGRAQLASVFKEVLMTRGVRRPAGWDTRRHGSGILDAVSLLTAPLPDTPPADGFRALRSAGPTSRTGLDEIVALFPGVSPATVRRGVVRLLRTDETELGRVLEAHRSELRLHLGVDPGLRAQVLALGRGDPEDATADDAVVPAPRLHRTASSGLRRQMAA